MVQDPFPADGQDEEPDGSDSLPGEEDGPEQGLFVCLPAEELTLAGFAEGGRADTMPRRPHPAPAVSTPRRPHPAALVTITVPLAALLGRDGAPGEAAGFGLLDPATARDLVTAAARHPRTRWCLTAVHPDGTAAAHARAPGRHQIVPALADLATSCDSRAGPDPPPGREIRDALASLAARLTPIARGRCSHRHAETGYQTSRKLAHLITARSARCTAPGCGRPAARCDLDHTHAWHNGGATCECNLGPPCRRHHHRCKQAEGWWLEQREPGVLSWRTPSGRTYMTGPTQYPM